MRADISILTATLCAAFILTLSGCGAMPPGAVRKVVDERWPRVEPQECPNTTYIYISNGLPDDDES